MDTNYVAIYLDFENLAISAESVYPSRVKPFELEPLVDYATTKGVICVRKAYADWSQEAFAKYQGRLMEQGFELIHMPATNQQGKNGCDVRLAIDTMEYLEVFPDIGTVIIGSGDTDFIPLIQRMKARGKQVIMIGFEHSVGTLVKRNSTEFKSLDELIGKPEVGANSHDSRFDPDLETGRNLLLRFMRTHVETGPVLMSRLKQHLLRLDPSFSERELGFHSFKDFIESLREDLIEDVVIDEHDLPVVHFRELPDHESVVISPDAREMALRFLSKKLRYQKRAALRLEMSEALYSTFQMKQPLSMNEMFDSVSDRVGRSITKSDIKKYVNTLFTGGAFKPITAQTSGPLLSRPVVLHEVVQTPDVLDQIYIRRVSEILQSRYTDLEPQEILELLI
ncbi:NYN domain-containing protein [Pontibacter sp. G13]|uniref:NYN domain-containing protein n=1 Tax=Pontibacter sp. G13 TaxID=3074898 RepID=UPI00288C4327|nr:NYN domain-containing protein [Pontibacter sp. G13]WNJ16763.1 NYN domain-containing protein [Pontibacter sp. G13]